MTRIIVLALACAAVVAAIAVPIASAHKRGDAKRHSERTRSSERSGDRLCGMDTEYLKESMEGDLFEIEGGKIALRMSSNAAVRNLASALISDHQKSYADAVDLAHRFGVPVQTDPSPSEQWELQAIQQFSGAQFNHQYALLEVYDHMQDIDLATHEAPDGCASSVRENARNELPMLERHLAHSKRALAANP